MWKRLNNSKGTRQPTYPDERDEYKYHEKTYTPTGGSSHSHGVGLGIEVQSPPQSPPARPPREDMGMEAKGLPRLPFELAPPPHRSSKYRPASSIYSQPSPAPIVTRFPSEIYDIPASPYSEVSPPSSPEFEVQQRIYTQHIDDEVSPIDEMPDVAKLGTTTAESNQEQPESSSIPTLRREKRRNQVATTAANLMNRKEIGGQRPAKNPSWDPYSGEPTTSERGKKQTTKPGEFTPPGLRSTGAALGNTSKVTSNSAIKKPISFGERVRNLKISSPSEPKPEWKGASGRATLVTTPADRLDIPPISLPRKDTKPLNQNQTKSSNVGSNAPVSPAQRSRVVAETGTASTHGDISTRSDNQSSSRVKPSPKFDSKNSDELNESPVRENIPRKKANTSSPREESNPKSGYKNTEPTPPPPAPYVQPPSRFSTSTYATSEARSTPRPSTDTFEPISESQPPIPPMPSMPSPPQTFSAQPDSVLERARPKIGTVGRAHVPRKALNTASPVFISMQEKRASQMSKSLPVTPAERESHDLVTSLQAQLDDLQHRRNNITNSIRQMTELMPADNITLTTEVRRKREIEKRKVEGLREEEADVRQQEHEIGLRLHRAWKRRDKEATYEPTGLWVRRVTG
ncbi:hypothetical protein HYFRA_00012891 [Hymenoscyphus fraxineus]|uniref:Uncharacterized protein n=1 Tax=Hymenoscyphus fraxineus TaxID=746836 RepID=A0A9N9PLV7_9HELO|nr:hypothetical protein HYFRA_00012891 [Hymenoscyphus fraxineus]